MRVICFGDSNTYGYDPRAYFGGRYPAESRWVDLLTEKTGWEIINAGENGREIPRREYELIQINQILSQRPVDLLIVMLGTNDLLQGATPETATARMEAFLTQLPLSKEQILLIAPPTMQLGEWVTEKSLITASEQLAVHYETLARRLGISFADAGKWNISLTFDGVHFTEEGHKTFALGLYTMNI